MLNRIKDIIYNLVSWLARMGPSTTHSGKVLIVRVDEIGDYMLWRPLIPELCKAERFNGMQFTLCGNSSWRSLYEQLNADTFDQTVWLDKTRFKQDLFYRYRFLQAIDVSVYFQKQARYTGDLQPDQPQQQSAAGRVGGRRRTA